MDEGGSLWMVVVEVGGVGGVSGRPRQKRYASRWTWVCIFLRACECLQSELMDVACDT